MQEREPRVKERAAEDAAVGVVTRNVSIATRILPVLMHINPSLPLDTFLVTENSFSHFWHPLVLAGKARERGLKKKKKKARIEERETPIGRQEQEGKQQEYMSTHNMQKALQDKNGRLPAQTLVEALQVV